MSTQKTDDGLPSHPFFENVIDQASFTDCINAIDRVRTVISLSDALTLDEEQGGLSPDAAFSFYWVTVLTRSALSYVSDRLLALSREDEERQEQESAYPSALFNSLPALSDECRERLLHNMAAQMDITRSDIEQFIEN
ncbi:MAG: hypothetical protein ABW157_22170 [Candidatus Thiodiazotropha sp. LLP2]